MVIQTACTVCRRDLSNEMFKLHVLKWTLKKVCETSDVRIYGIDCCVPLLQLRMPTIRLYGLPVESQSILS